MTFRREWQKRAFIDDAKYEEMYARSINDPNGFWARAGQAPRLDQAVHQGQEHLASVPRHLDQMVRGRHAQRLPTTASTGISPSAATRPRSSGKATIPRTTSKITYQQLHDEVCRFANVLKAHGVKKGDRVTIYMPMISEAAVAMLACARIGAIHSVVFGGFSPDSLAGRISDCAVEHRDHRRRRRARRQARFR